MTYHHDDSDEVSYEPIRGLPSELPAGEHILWQGSPQWRRLARDAFHVRGLAAYFAVFAALRGVVFWSEAGPLGAVKAVAEVAPLAALAIGIACGVAWLQARATVYTLTNQRVVLRVGAALPMTFNLPFRQLGSASHRRNEDGTGDVVLELAGSNRLGWAFLWPHARPWRFAKAQPMLRSIPDVDQVATLLGDAVRQVVFKAHPPGLRLVTSADEATTTRAAS